MTANKNKIIVHCADTYAFMDIGRAEIDAWHRARNWRAIGYNFVIKRDGTLELGRDLDGDGDVLEETGAHAQGFNTDSIGICLVGGKSATQESEANFTDSQMTTLRSLISTLRATLRGVSVMGHRDLPGVTKACPCFDVMRWWETGEMV